MGKKQDIRREFREAVFYRDMHCCVICRYKEDLDAHHITDRKEMPNGGYVASNGISLCPVCHEKAEKFHITGGKSWEPGMHPNDLYELIESSKEQAIKDSEALDK